MSITHHISQSYCQEIRKSSYFVRGLLTGSDECEGESVSLQWRPLYSVCGMGVEWVVLYGSSKRQHFYSLLVDGSFLRSKHQTSKRARASLLSWSASISSLSLLPIHLSRPPPFSFSYPLLFILIIKRLSLLVASVGGALVERTSTSRLLLDTTTTRTQRFYR